MFDFPVILTPDDGTVLVTFPDVPEAITFGADTDEALLQAVDALESALSFYVDDRKPLPVPSKAKRGQRTVCPSALECAKLGVYRAMTEQGIKKSELATPFGLAPAAGGSPVRSQACVPFRPDRGGSAGAGTACRGIGFLASA
jgi:antitoxin HicB